MSNTELGAINTAVTGGVTPVENLTYQSYSYTFTATQALENVSFLFRNDPGYTWLDTVSVADTTAPAANLLTNGGFDDGPQPTDATVPLGWSRAGDTSLTGEGDLGTAAGSNDAGAAPQAGTYFWVDGATAGYDGLTQQVTLTAGDTYTLSFGLAVDPNNGPPDTDGTDGGIDTQIWVGPTAQNDPAPCFVTGTRIATSRGDVPVEQLEIGDLAVTHDGGLRPVVWIGRSPFNADRHPNPAQAWPVRIRAGALAAGLPRRDLLVSPGHSLLIDGVLMQAERLVNGATIVRDTALTRGLYFHVELESHDILLSEGVPSESYLDTGNRSAFVNGGPFVDLHPDFSARDWTETCVPLVQDGPMLAAARQRLIDRAADLGWRRRLEAEPLVSAGGRPIQPLHRDGKRWTYDIPEGAGTVRLRSCSAIPAELLACSSDLRRLGLWIDGLAVVTDGHRRELGLADPALSDGWHDVEGSGAWRWTDGDAGLSIAAPCRLEVSVGCCLPGWEDAPPEALALAG